MAVEAWMVTAGANTVMVVIYALIAVEMVSAIVKGRQLRTNPLLVATAAVFVTCTLGHGFHLTHTLVAWAGPVGIEAARASFGDPRLLAWDVFTAGTAIYFYTLRSRFAIVYRGAALCEDMAKREAQAMDLHDSVVQGLVEAKMHLDLGDRNAGRAAVERTLGSARGIITELLGKQGTEVELGPGDLRRAAPAGDPK
jgi:hypothetical protein